MTRAEAWVIHRKGVETVERVLRDRTPGTAFYGYGYTYCERLECTTTIPIVEGMAPEFCPACDPELEDD